jgi:D-tyrosyl-tRNA(Tyr) deacylase
VRAVVQRVERASVTVDGTVVGAIAAGLLVLVGVAHGDDASDAQALVDKLLGLRIFPDDEGRMNRSVADAGGSVLVVSQFTLLGNVKRGRRPSFSDAAPPEHAEPLVARMLELIASHGIPSESGRFGAHMDVELVNKGPVTLVLDVADGRVQ